MRISDWSSDVCSSDLLALVAFERAGGFDEPLTLLLLFRHGGLMRLRDGGIDVFYIDESHDNKTYVVTALAVPFLRRIDNVWTITWASHFEKADRKSTRLNSSH